ncbi:hypothetical protein C8R44DRAFT_736515 [Mycena epipterygia]|nr:hypothetical protein C8R44DRAFT_736515 [Mycena epipterygia]
MPQSTDLAGSTKNIESNPIFDNTPDNSGSEEEPAEPVVPAAVHVTCRATMEEVDDEESLISFRPTAGSSREKGGSRNPHNWGGIRVLDGFSESELRVQCEVLQNYAEINPIIEKDVKTTPSDFLADKLGHSTAKTPSSKGKARRRRSKSPKSTKFKGAKVERHTLVEPLPMRVERNESSTVEPTKSKDSAAASDRNAKNNRESMSGFTVAEMHALIDKKTNELKELEERQTAETRRTRYTNCYAR